MIFTFGHRERSPDRTWHRRGRSRYNFPPSYLYTDDSSSTESDDSSCSDGGYGLAALFRHRHRHRHQNHRQQPRHPNALVLNNGHVALGHATNRLVRPVTAPAHPRNYGYRRLHVQGGQERDRRQTRRAHHDHCHAHQRQHHQQKQGQQRQCILMRCCRWIFGGPSESCTCEDERGVLRCGGGRSRSRSTSPMRHREEEYWGPGTHVCPIAGSDF